MRGPRGWLKFGQHRLPCTLERAVRAASVVSAACGDEKVPAAAPHEAAFELRAKKARWIHGLIRGWW